MKLSSLCQVIGITLPSWIRDVSIKGISQNSKIVSQGDLFIAMSKTHALEHMEEAYAKGAHAILTSPSIEHLIPSPFPLPVVPILKPLRKATAELCQTFYAPYPEHIIAVTGTNGKTSTAYFVYQMLTLMNQPAAYIGSTGSENNVDIDLPHTGLTSPAAPDIHKALHLLKQNGCKYACIEASSHALDQYRLHGLPITHGAFTNLSVDHLDYHQSLEAYFSAKKQLFQEVLGPHGTVVINNDAPQALELKKISDRRHQTLITYGINNPESDFYAANIQLAQNHIRFDFLGPSKILTPLMIPLVGEFQVSNILCAMALTYRLGFEEEEIKELLSQLRSPKGRMEFVGRVYDKGGIYVDYAHTPDALEKSLQSLKKQTPGHLIVVFGCGGDRDATKRPLMGAVAQKYADVIYVTDDNPRTENPDLIRKQVSEGCFAAINVDGRDKAIEMAITNLRPKDNLLIAGKGHEDYQIIGLRHIPFSDHEHVKLCIKKIKESHKEKKDALAS